MRTLERFHSPASMAAAAVIFTVCVTQPAPLSGQTTLPMPVRTYNSFGVSAPDLHAAAAHAFSLLEEAGVSMTWRECRTADGPSKAAPPCDDLPLPAELIVRIVAGPAANGSEAALGEATVDPRTGEGALATIFGDRIAAVADEAGIARALLLGRVLAHELGHLLMGTTAHSRSGLMRASWPVRRLRQALPGDWRFASEDASRLRAALERRTLMAAVRQPR